MHILMLYGLPCSGKTSLLNSLKNYSVMGVDSVIKSLIKEPMIPDFIRLASDIRESIIQSINPIQTTNIAIEMGCLTPKESIEKFELFFKENKINYINLVLTASHNELINRIKKRNIEVSRHSKSKALIIDGPDYLSRFTEHFEKNRPQNEHTLDTTGKTSDELFYIIQKLVNTPD